MAQVTKTFTENDSASYQSTWALRAVGTNVTVSGDTVTVAVPVIYAKYIYGGGQKNKASAKVEDAIVTIGANSTRTVSYTANEQAWSTNTEKMLTRSTTSVSVPTNTVFTGSNSTSRTVSVYLNSNSSEYKGYVFLESYRDGSSSSYENAYRGFCGLWGSLATVTLDAPPTATVSAVSYDTTYVYAGLTTASVTVSDVTAYYGGAIDSVTLTIGNQTDSISGNGTLSIPLNAGGEFTPVVTVTDSRGQVYTETLAPITVNVYTPPSVNFSAERTTSTGVPDDEGTYATLSTTLTFTDAITTNKLREPTVAVADEDGNTYTPTKTWYTTRASNGALSGAVTWANVSSGDTVYGLVTITGGFNTQKSYTISVTPEDNEDTGTTITQTLATAFYTVDFLAGGHGIAFGQPASQTGFYCNMGAHFADANNVMRALFDFVYPVGSYYETSDTSFDPNVTWGGTWSLETEGQVHISSGANYAVAGALTNTSDGGEASHTLTVDEIPSHTHTLDYAQYNRGTGSATASALQYSGSTETTNATGGGQAHNNLPPYIIVNRWHRTA